MKEAYSYSPSPSPETVRSTRCYSLDGLACVAALDGMLAGNGAAYALM